jgi:hypothetical protein
MAKLLTTEQKANIEHYKSIVFCDKEPKYPDPTVNVFFAVFFKKIRESEQAKGVDTAKKLETFLWLALRTPVPENVEFLILWKCRIIACINILRRGQYSLMIYPRDDPAVKQRSEAMLSSIEIQYRLEISKKKSDRITALELPVSKADAERPAVFAAALATLKRPAVEVAAAAANAAQQSPAVEEIQPSRRSERVANKRARTA